jgi:hypothetical protein
MATQSSPDEEMYKREYCRIKTLVSSAYVRQTSVSFVYASKFWEIGKTCLAITHVPQLLCHGCDLLKLYFFDNLELRGEGKVSALMQHISRMGSDCLIFIDFTSNWSVSVKVFPELLPLQMRTSFFFLQRCWENHIEMGAEKTFKIFPNFHFVYDPIKLKHFCTQKNGKNLLIFTAEKLITFSMADVKPNLCFSLLLFLRLRKEKSFINKVIAFCLSCLSFTRTVGVRFDRGASSRWAFVLCKNILKNRP